MRLQTSRLSGRRAALLAGVCLFAGAPLAAQAQAPTPAQGASTAIEEVVVTAQKRAENVQNVPIAITAITGQKVQSQGVVSSLDLTQVVPGLNMSEAVGVDELPFIRGVGTTSQGAGVETPVATYVDGVYIYSQASAVLALHDIDQIAVLKGPQGTLFGRNATGGVIQYTTKAPSHAASFDADVSAGNVGYVGANFYGTTGITDQLAINLAASFDNQSQGFGRNLFNGEWVYTYHQDAFRSKLLWQPDNKTDITLSGDYRFYSGAQPVNRMALTTVLGVPMPGGPWNTDLDLQPHSQVEASGASLTIKRDLGFAQGLSITAWRHDRVVSQFDADGTEYQLEELHSQAQDSQWTQEFQLVSPDSGPLTWVGGLFLMGAENWGTGDNTGSFYNPQHGFFPPTAARCVVAGVVVSCPTNGWTVTHGKLFTTGVFAQGVWRIDSATNLTGGLRWSWDDRDASSAPFTGTFQAPTVATGGVARGSTRFADPTYRVSLDHRFSPELMAYFSFNHGFRSGQIQLGKAATATAPAIPATPVNPETLDAFEGGFKADLFDRRLRINASGYYYLDHNRVSFQIINGTSTLLDAKLATLYGVDADAVWRVTNQFSIDAGVAWEHAVYTKFGTAACSGSTYIFGCGTMLKPIVPPYLPQGNYSLTYGNDTGKYVEYTPSFTLNIGPAYRLPTSIGDFTAALNYYYNSGWYASPDNYSKQAAYSTLAVDLLWTPSSNRNLSIRLWGKNLTNANYAEQFTETTPGPNYQVAPGRTYGVTLGLKY